MTDQFNHDEKFKLYSFLMQHGFESSQKPEMLDGSIPGRDISEIKALLEAYKKNDTPDTSNIWIGNILNLKQHYKHEAFYNLLADVMIKKTESLQPNDQYREVYLFLSKVLTGEFPDIENTSDHTIMVILLLLQDLNKLIKTTTDCDVHACLTAIDSEENEENTKTRKDLMERLTSLFKFKRINEFINPLQIPNNVNERVYKNIFK